MEKTNNRQEFTGRVISAANNKTITVLVETYKKDPLYGKRVKYSKKYAAHDENNKAKIIQEKDHEIGLLKGFINSLKNENAILG